jgi:hypothetical protein
MPATFPYPSSVTGPPHSMTTVILGVFLCVAALATIGVAGFLILGPVRRPLVAAVERARVRRCVARRGRGDALLAADDVRGALREFAAAFCFVVPRADTRLAVEIDRLHTGLLSRFISIGDDLPGDRVQLLALAKVERLLDQWAEIQRHVARRAPSATDAVAVRRQRQLIRDAIRELTHELLARRQRPLLH